MLKMFKTFKGFFNKNTNLFRENLTMRNEKKMYLKICLNRFALRFIPPKVLS